MTTSGTTSFNIAGGELISYAYSLCGLRRTELLQEHMTDARLALNLLQASWGNDTPNLWTVDQVTVNLVQGTATYDVDPDTIMILDAYIRTGDPTDAQNLTDRIIWPISRTEYASMPNKGFQAPPTVFWFDRLLAPTITLWQVPQVSNTSSAANQLIYYRCTVMQDADPKNGVTLDIPRWWQLAIAVGLAELLSLSYAPDRMPALKIKAKETLMRAQAQDVEGVPLYILPGLSAYTPR